MNIRAVTFDRLTNAEIAAWSAVQRDNQVFASPYFRPEFTQAVASVRGDVEIAILDEDGCPVGFFPYQRTSWGAGRPVGGRLSDFHTLIASPEVECDPLDLMRACRLSSWQFDHLVPADSPFARFAWTRAESPYIDISQGFDHYIAHRENGNRILAEYRRKTRRLERQFGAVRHEPHEYDPEVVETCIRWKSEQYARTDVDDIFKYSWVVELLHGILACRGSDFAPMVSVTYAGDRIAAINFGMRSQGVFHSWFPAYDAEMREYSPGAIQWIEMLKSAKSVGLTRIDLGKGDESYKKRLMTGAIHLAEGSVDVRRSVVAARRAWRCTRESIKASPLYGPARGPARVLRRVKSWLELG